MNILKFLFGNRKTSKIEVEQNSVVSINGIVCKGNIEVKDGIIYCDGVKQEKTVIPPIHVTITGNTHSIENTSGNITVQGHVHGSISTVSGTVDCKEITGNVNTVSGDVNAKIIHGNVDTVSGDITK